MPSSPRAGRSRLLALVGSVAAVGLALAACSSSPSAPSRRHRPRASARSWPRPPPRRQRPRSSSGRSCPAAQRGRRPRAGREARQHEPRGAARRAAGRRRRLPRAGRGRADPLCRGLLHADPQGDRADPQRPHRRPRAASRSTASSPSPTPARRHKLSRSSPRAPLYDVSGDKGATGYWRQSGRYAPYDFFGNGVTLLKRAPKAADARATSASRSTTRFPPADAR